MNGLTINQIDKKIDLIEINIKAAERKIADYRNSIQELQEMRKKRLETESLIYRLEKTPMNITELQEFIKTQRGVDIAGNATDSAE